MSPLHPVDWEILNATADDCENLEQIYLSLCFDLEQPLEGSLHHTYRRVRSEVLLREVADRVRALVEQGLLAPVMDEEGRPPPSAGDLRFVWSDWFTMTPEGRRLWAAADPADLVERK
jgi:hypothetical protein